MKFDKATLKEDYDYFSITINLESGEIKYFDRGSEMQKTTCLKEYLKKGDIFNADIPFTIGLQVAGSPGTANYSSFDLYACRLYTRVLSGTEISQNYTATTNYHNKLVNN